MFWPRDSRDTSEGKEAGISKAKNRGFSHFEHFLTFDLFFRHIELQEKGKKNFVSYAL